MCVCEWRPRSSGVGPAAPAAPAPADMASTVSLLPRHNSAASRASRASPAAAPQSKLAGGKSSDVWREKRWRKGDENGSLLTCLALQALELSAPASGVLLRSSSPPWSPSATSQSSAKAPSTWFQVAGHPDCFQPAGDGKIWKKLSDTTEETAYESLTREDGLRDLVPEYFGSVDYRGHTFIKLQDLLHGFSDPHVIDVKLGTRTFLESEVDNATARADLYQKMVAVDSSAPTPEEHAAKAVTKVRYMQFREEQSSTHFLGFRVDAMKAPGQPPRASELRKVSSRQEVVARMTEFLAGREDVKQQLVKRLCHMRARIEQSEFFRRHEVIGCSVFMLYDESRVGAWLIDFAKTVPIPDLRKPLNHRSPWEPGTGNHEEGFLLGLDNLIEVLKDAETSH